ncbi:MAG: TIGR03619 family F420-dependent LLM class oxidoreductase [Novosphingobium sp.]|nr:TIGR03619 family F420-dependent LLM class oxidoreductase [Novosphingobium sp.]
MRFSCSLPIEEARGDEFQSLEAICEMARAVEAAGLDAIFVTDHPAPSRRWLDGGGHETYDPFVALTAVACGSPRLLLHTHILVLAYRNPFVVAKAAASLDALSGGRLVLGIGTGYLKPEYAALGVDFDARGAITDESLRIMRQAWTGEPVHYEGPRFVARDTVIRPVPPHPHGVTVWAGGNANVAIRRAVEMCEGWCPFPVEGIVTRTARTEELSNLDQLKAKLAYARDHAERIGRTRKLDVCMGRFPGAELRIGNASDAARAVDDYCALHEAGVTWTTMHVPAPSRAGFVENIQWFGEEIARKVKAAIGS